MQAIEGQIVRHPKLGLCRVVTAFADRITVIKEDGGETKILKAYFEQHCVEVLTSEMPPAHPLLNRSPFPTISTGTAAASLAGSSTRPCEHCRRPLNRSQYSADRRAKSCPNCSKHSRQHVFHHWPAAFSTTDKRANPRHPEGTQSWCTLCRFGDGPARGTSCDRIVP